MADTPRFYLPDLPAEVEPDAPPLALPAGEAHHAAHVLRLRPGAQIQLLDGRGRRGMGIIQRARHGEVTVTIAQMSAPSPRPRPAIHLAFAVPKGKRLDWLLEKATELGAATLAPVVFERSVAGGEELSDHQRERWMGHCISAGKQSGCDWLPELAPPVKLAAFLEGLGLLEPPQRRIVGHPGPESLSVPEALGPGPLDAIWLLVGPEGGLTDAELAQARSAGFASARIGANVLRVETACLALLAAARAQADLWTCP